MDVWEPRGCGSLHGICIPPCARLKCMELIISQAYVPLMRKHTADILCRADMPSHFTTFLNMDLINSHPPFWMFILPSLRAGSTLRTSRGGPINFCWCNPAAQHLTANRWCQGQFNIQSRPRKKFMHRHRCPFHLMKSIFSICKAPSRAPNYCSFMAKRCHKLVWY